MMAWDEENGVDQSRAARRQQTSGIKAVPAVTRQRIRTGQRHVAVLADARRDGESMFTPKRSPPADSSACPEQPRAAVNSRHADVRDHQVELRSLQPPRRNGGLIRETSSARPRHSAVHGSVHEPPAVHGLSATHDTELAIADQGNTW